MADKLYKLYGSVSANTNDVAHLDFQEPGQIEGLLVSATLISSTLASGTGCVVEISFASLYQGQVNDIRQSLIIVPLFFAFTTSGATVPTWSEFVAFIDGIDVAQGQRIYMNVGEFAGTAVVHGYAHFYNRTSGSVSGLTTSMGGIVPRRRRRRAY